MDVTTLARVKAFVIPAGDTNTDYDALLGALIISVSASFENYLDRHLQVAARTEYLDVAEGQQLFRPRGYPITAVTSLTNASDWQFSGGLTVDPTAMMFLGNDGALVIRDILSPGLKVAQLIYTGGMALDATAFILAFPQIAQAADEQVSYLFRRRQNLGSSTSIEGASINYVAPYQLLESVKQVLQPFRRKAVC